jgi:hypothetical protein
VSRSYLHDPDFLRIAQEEPDVVSVCYEIARKYGRELTLEQGQRLVDRAGDLCPDHFTPLDDEGHCPTCEEPCED